MTVVTLAVAKRQFRKLASSGVRDQETGEGGGGDLVLKAGGTSDLAK